MVTKTVKSIFTSPSSLPLRLQAIAKKEDLARRKYIRWDSLRPNLTVLNDTSTTNPALSPTTTTDASPTLQGTFILQSNLPTHLQQGDLFSHPATYPATSQTTSNTSTVTITISGIPPSPHIQPFTFLNPHPPSSQPRYTTPQTHRFGAYICKFSLLAPAPAPSPSSPSISSSGGPPATTSRPAHPLLPENRPTQYTLQVQLLESLAEQPISDTEQAGDPDQRGGGGAFWDGEKFPWQDLGTLRFYAAGGQGGGLAEDGVGRVDMAEAGTEGARFEAYWAVGMM